MDINEMATEVNFNAAKHGFYDDYQELMKLVSMHGTSENVTFLRQIWLSHRLMLIVSELAEGLEAIRDNNFSSEPKSGGLGEELIDANIRTSDLFKHISPEDYSKKIAQKMLYNASRPYKHGRSL